MRADGLWRTSRPFSRRFGRAHRAGAAWTGLIRGDRFASSGTVGPGAHLIVAGQMATRILPGQQPVTTSATWSVEAGGMLELLAEPTMICEGAAYDMRLTLALAGDARAILSEIVVCAESATARIETTVTRDGHTVVVDVLKLSDGTRDKAANVVEPSPCSDPRSRRTRQRAADECPNARIGIGTFQAATPSCASPARTCNRFAKPSPLTRRNHLAIARRAPPRQVMLAPTTVSTSRSTSTSNEATSYQVAPRLQGRLDRHAQFQGVFHLVLHRPRRSRDVYSRDFGRLARRGSAAASARRDRRRQAPVDAHHRELHEIGGGALQRRVGRFPFGRRRAGHSSWRAGRACSGAGRAASRRSRARALPRGCDRCSRARRGSGRNTPASSLGRRAVDVEPLC